MVDDGYEGIILWSLAKKQRSMRAVHKALKAGRTVIISTPSLEHTKKWIEDFMKVYGDSYRAQLDKSLEIFGRDGQAKVEGHHAS